MRRHFCLSTCCVTSVVHVQTSHNQWVNPKANPTSFPAIRACCVTSGVHVQTNHNQCRGESEGKSDVTSVDQGVWRHFRCSCSDQTQPMGESVSVFQTASTISRSTRGSNSTRWEHLTITAASCITGATSLPRMAGPPS